ncbi:MAG: transglutaminase-like domain-containing protein [Bacteroidota bacterium]|nr:transglutaminase-like domain-containing protein [Bacteroidota bacterium]
MKIEKLHSNKKTAAQLFMLVLPAGAVGTYMLWHINQYYSVLNDQWLNNSLYLAAGLITGCIFYNYRFRFISTIIPLILLLLIISKIISNTFTGEFSAFYAATNFFIFSFLFIAGWLIGWGFARLRYFPVILSAILLAIQIVVVSKTSDITAQKLIIAFAPVLVFALYIIYTAELVRNMSDDEPAFAWFIGKKIIGFALVSSIILLLIFSLFNKEFKAIEKEFGGAGKQQKETDKESLTKENKDGTVSNRKEMGMSGGRSSSKRLVFIAKLDNYFPNSETPNPLYFTYDYFTKFDTLTQTLETDSLMPSNDLFQPDPSKIPLYFTQSDSSVILKAKGYLKRKVVTTEVYKALLSPQEFLAPSTAFFCQPIAVEKEYKDQFKTAYRAKMYVSDLNSAYFIYNPAGNQSLETFQQQRFDELRKVNSWNNEDKNFIDYYTFIPKGDAYDSIRALAQELTKNAVTPIDKMIAIREYFLSKDENGQPLFKYTDNPGIPGLPSANKLTYFLFDNRKGYCAYFAGATLFLLRALGIPSRVATGFLTVDRSDKNKGWYWFYEDQAHAWTEAYFPGYGWIDFDTTIPSTEQQQSPAPDGTPPITVQSAYFVTTGKVLSVDTSKKRVEMQVTKMIFHDKTFDLKEPVYLDMDVSIATINKDTGSVLLSELKQGMQITALSFSEQFKNIIPVDSNSSKEIFLKIPHPAPIDEIRIQDTKKEKQQKEQPKKEKRSLSITKLILLSLAILGGIILLIFCLPWFIYRWFKFRALQKNDVVSKAYWQYTSAMYLLNQLGFARNDLSPLQFAKQQVDPQFKTDLSAFVQVYLKSKYSAQPLTPTEEKIVTLFYHPFEISVKNYIPFKMRLNKFLNFYRTINYFTKPKI